MGIDALIPHPTEVVLAATRFYSGLPVVGKHLEPFAGLTAMAMWGGHYASPAVKAAVTRRIAPAPAAPVGDDVISTSRIPPYLSFRGQRRRCLHRSGVRYGNHPSQVLDVWRRPDLPPDAPVLLFVPGGAWVQGTRVLQGHTLLDHLVKQGWVCLTMDYRVSPVHAWPRHIADVNAAIAWARANVDRFGGNRDFVALAGCSAGGHMAALAGLTPGDERFRGELTEDADTSVDAVVGIYGRYDWQDRSTAARRSFQTFLERVVVRRKQSEHPDVFEAASPMARVHAGAPPFYLIHGEQDTIIPVGEAHAFRDRLREVSRNPVGYYEVPRAGHAFDLVDTSHARRCAVEVAKFLNETHERRTHLAAVAAG